MQRRLWAAQCLSPRDPLYNTAWRFEFGPTDPDRFERALHVLADACDALRLVFDDGGEGPVARVLPGLAGQHRTVHMSRQDALADMNVCVRQPFDLPKATIDSALYVLPDGGAIWFLNMHHIVNDGASGRVLFDRMAEAYDGRDLAPLPSFADYMAGFDDRIPEVDRSFWQSWQQTTPGLPRLYTRTLSGTASRACERFVTLTPDQMARLNARAASRGFASLSRDQTIFTLFETVLAAWAHRVATTDTVAIGVATHGRQSPTERAMAGCFVDLFPVDVAIEADETFTSLYTKLRTRNMEVLRHARPGAFEARGEAPFSVVVNHVPLRFGPFDGVAPTATWLGNGHVDPVHAVHLNLLDPGADGALTLKVLFNAEIVPEQEGDGAVAHLMALLDAILDAPETAVGAVPMAASSDASYRLLAAPLEAGEVPDVLAVFEDQCRADPDALCVSEGAAQWSRRDLSDRASSVAAALVAGGMGPGSRVGINLRRGFDLLAALLGVLRVGATFVPLDPTQPEGRLEAIVEDAGLACILTNTRPKRGWPGAPPLIRMDDVPDTDSDHRPEVAPGPAYVLFTSGSTGRPKGVQVGRAALSRYAHWAAATHAGGAATWALHSAIGFDLTLTSIFAPLMSGGAIRIYPEADDDDSGPDLSVLEVFAEDAVDVVKLTPRHLTLALEAGTPVSRIRSLVLGGEELTTALAKRALATAGADIAIHNEYGPTEAVVGCMDHLFDPARDTDATVPIGRAADATRVSVRDAALNPVPDRVIGQLYVSGKDRLADGYLDRADETAERFVTDPQTGERMYATGDLASVRADGVMLYHGRRDDQLKRGGLRIERGELAQAALGARGVSDCAIVNFDPGTGEEDVLTCYFVGDTTVEAVRAAMARRVPRAVIPPYIVPVPAIPLTANGKVDEAALPSPFDRPPEQGRGPRVALDGNGAQLLAIWQVVLKRPELAPGDNFYDLGGSSIAAIQIATRAQAQGLNVSPMDIFRQQSVAALAEALPVATPAAAAPARMRAEVSGADRAKLAALLGKPNG
ncbi:MAG: amino acid adenylation domain-containing protein [Pseudomonadota bacterium]